MSSGPALAVVPLVVFLGTILATLVVFTVKAALVGRPHTPDIEKRQRTILAKFFQEWWIWLWGPIERLCLRLHVSPDAITLASTTVGAGAAVLFGLGWLSLGGWVFLAGSSLDFIDGRVARATGRVSRAGAFLDSTLDRVSELLVFGGLAAINATTNVTYMTPTSRAEAAAKDSSLANIHRQPH